MGDYLFPTAAIALVIMVVGIFVLPILIRGG